MSDVEKSWPERSRFSSRFMAAVAGAMDQAELRRQIVAIQGDASLSDAEKAKQRQALLSGSWQPAAVKAKEGMPPTWEGLFILRHCSVVV